MEGLSRWASAHVEHLALASIVIAVASALSIARCCAVHAPESEGAQASPESVADEELGAEYRALRKSYADVTKDALSMLVANVWTDAQGTAVVTFTDRALCVRSEGEESWLAFAVLAAYRSRATNDGETSTVTTLCLHTTEWTDIAMLAVPDASGGEGRATFSCPSLRGGTELGLSTALKELQTDGPGEDVLAAHGTSDGDARAALSSWCALWRPTATTATWTKVIEEDHKEGVYEVYYKLDDRRGSTVTLVVAMDGSGLSVREGGR